jgi:aminopeptidase N
LDTKNPAIVKEATPILSELIKNDKYTLVKAAAINALAKTKNAGHLPLFKEALKSQSYSVQGSALRAVSELEPAEGLRLAKTLEKDSKGNLKGAVADIYSEFGGPAEYSFVVNEFDNASVSGKFQMMESFFVLLGNMNETETFKTNLQKVTRLIDQYKQYGVGRQMLPLFNMLKETKAAKATENKELRVQLNSQIEIVNKVIADIESGKF